MSQANDSSQVKRFVAPNMRRALDLVNQEMGPEAVIISSRKIPEGVEIVTALEPDLPTRGIDTRREFGQKFDAEMDRAMESDMAWRSQAGIERAAASYATRPEPQASMNTRMPSEDLVMEIERARERMLEAKRQAKQQDNPMSESYGSSQVTPSSQLGATDRVSTHHNDQFYRDAQSSSAGTNRVEETAVEPNPAQANLRPQDAFEDEQRLQDLKGELAEMRMLLQQQMWRMNDVQGTGNNFNMPNQMKLPAHFSVLNDHLTRLGLNSQLSHRLTEQLGQYDRASDAWRNCMAQLAKTIPVYQGDLLDEGGVFAFLGQTGVGKTTTVAKLAAQYVLRHGPGKVALVTTDTYRVGAYDQLRSIGRILNVPVKAVDGDNSLQSVLASFRQYPVVLIDTAGFRFGDPLLKAQNQQIDNCAAVKKVLVLACTSQLPNMKASQHAFQTTKALHAAVMTKLDEAMSLGDAISAIVDGGIPLSYTTDGQEIPDDIAQASGHTLVARAVTVMKENHSSFGQSVGNL